MRFELVHELPRDPDTTWKVLWSDEYETAAGANTKIDKELLEHTDEGGKKFYRHRITSDRKLPGPIAKVMGGDALSYELVETFDDANRSSTWKIIPSKMADRILAEGTYKVEPGPTPDTCVRRITGEVKVSIAIVGKKIESLIESEVRASYERSTEFAREYLRNH